MDSKINVSKVKKNPQKSLPALFKHGIKDYQIHYKLDQMYVI